MNRTQHSLTLAVIAALIAGCSSGSGSSSGADAGLDAAGGAAASGGSGNVAGLGGGGLGGGGGGACKVDGQLCAAFSECCSGSCNDGRCGSLACVESGGACVVFGDCCTNSCELGRCAGAPNPADGGDAGLSYGPCLQAQSGTCQDFCSSIGSKCASACGPEGGISAVGHETQDCSTEAVVSFGESCSGAISDLLQQTGMTSIQCCCQG